uniref:Transmembrane protein 198 n=1 Tax=Hucho hucho TaxID=62062 RepID=A0A4W5LP45_9TELE
MLNRILHWNGDDFSSLGFGPEAVAGITIAIGTVLTFFGYKLVRPAIFVAGFIVGAVACFLLAERIFANASYIVTACWIAFVLGGLLVGSLLVWLYKVGIFCVGALAGVLLATQIHNSFGYKIAPAHPDTVLIVLMVVLGLALGVLAWKLERPFLVFASSVVGAIATVWGIGDRLGRWRLGLRHSELVVVLPRGHDRALRPRHLCAVPRADAAQAARGPAGDVRDPRDAQARRPDPPRLRRHYHLLLSTTIPSISNNDYFFKLID